MKIVRYILGAISAVSALIFLILAIRLCSVIGGIPAEATGTVLTDEFIQADCVRHALSYQRAMLFVAAFVLALTSLLAFLFKSSDKSLTSSIFKWVSLLTLITTCFGAALAPAPDAISVLMYDPVVYKGHVTDKYEGQDKDGNHKYILEFDGKSTISVNSSEYNKAQQGKNYYLVYFGTELFGAYDAMTYSLPEN